MSDHQLRIQQRYDYSDSGSNLINGPLDSYSQARDPVRILSDESSDETNSSYDSCDTIVQNEGLSDLSEELKNLTIMSMEQDAIAKKMFASQESLHEDIVDFIDENPLNRLKTVEDINAFIMRIEDLRSKYRNVHKEMCNVVQHERIAEFKQQYEKMLKTIKEVLADVKDIKTAMQNIEEDLEEQKKV